MRRGIGNRPRNTSSGALIRVHPSGGDCVTASANGGSTRRVAPKKGVFWRASAAGSLPEPGETVEQRRLGGTGITISALGFGCGTAGGLMNKGDPREQRE